MLIHRFFFNDAAPSEIYTLSLHDALPISRLGKLIRRHFPGFQVLIHVRVEVELPRSHQMQYRHGRDGRSEEHTSELQSLTNLVCRLLLEKKKHHTGPRVVIR